MSITKNITDREVLSFGIIGNIFRLVTGSFLKTQDDCFIIAQTGDYLEYR